MGGQALVGTLCPSVPAESAGSVVLGVVDACDGEPFVRYTADAIAVTPEILALARGAQLNDVFRFAGPCAESACAHFDNSVCRLARKIVDKVGDTVDAMPFCAIRSRCRWFAQEGRAACIRCPLILSDAFEPSPALAYAADPAL